ncbi:hypothetical protein, unlikely [Trypanosoma brucei brucei TREU927]|uniref:Uncharacterized protein n=1 Tax=Trypanosoma brucei brucei (strain 927/4 GUTat10.1) TaxID=185431 RepID=Q38EQ3_TRYB2|nr:hypothetical protein, unlikely [Trypanosoma brucei brucei TREU927]EAN76717.1 hypothetical protein, unlikely [Trypanosoma brucei brucei TREU927]
MLCVTSAIFLLDRIKNSCVHSTLSHNIRHVTFYIRTICRLCFPTHVLSFTDSAERYGLVWLCVLLGCHLFLFSFITKEYTEGWTRTQNALCRPSNR